MVLKIHSLSQYCCRIRTMTKELGRLALVLTLGASMASAEKLVIHPKEFPKAARLAQAYSSMVPSTSRDRSGRTLRAARSPRISKLR
jgi:hypothetical protein